jgi:hypothetical protein
MQIKYGTEIGIENQEWESSRISRVPYPVGRNHDKPLDVTPTSDMCRCLPEYPHEYKTLIVRKVSQYMAACYYLHKSAATFSASEDGA